MTARFGGDQMAGEAAVGEGGATEEWLWVAGKRP